MPFHRYPSSTVVAAALMTLVAPSQESRASRPTSQPSAESRTSSLRDLVDTGRDIVDAFKGDRFGMASRVVAEGFALQKEGKLDEAIQVFERVGREFPDTHKTISWMLVVTVHSSREDYDAAVAVVEGVLGRPGTDDYVRNIAYRVLESLHESRGDWRKALEAAEKSTTSDELDSSAGDDRKFRIARCRFHLGDQAAALTMLEALLKQDLPKHLAAEVAAAYAEYSGRSGKVVEARKFATTLGPEPRRLVEIFLRVVEAWLTKDLTAVLKAVAENKIDAWQYRSAARLLLELGPKAIETLARGIEAGDVHAIRLAGVSGRRELVAPLEKRLGAEGPDADAAGDAIGSLELAPSRPASRPAK